MKRPCYATEIRLKRVNEGYNIFVFMFCIQMISDLNTYLNKAVPDTRLTIKKYLDAKFEYLVSDGHIFMSTRTGIERTWINFSYVHTWTTC